MINSLYIKNFQSHKDSILEFSENVNVIIGESDSGKSSIIRAIIWLLTNRPKGSNFINDEENTVLVSLEMDNNILQRERTKDSTGSYKIGENVYSTMGQDVPAEVTQFLNLSDINVQSQLENHFLVLETPGKVAQYLNNITKLDKLTNAVDKLRSKKREEQKILDTNLQDVQKIENYLKSGIVETVVEVNKIYNEVLDKNERKTLQYLQIITVARIVSTLQEVEKQKVPVEKLKTLSECANEIGITINTYDILSDKMEAVKNVIKRLQEEVKRSDELSVAFISCNKDIQSIKTRLKDCPYCGQSLTSAAKERLLQ